MFMWWLFTMLFASFRCCFFGLVPRMSHLRRIRSTMFVCLLHGLVLLPCGISSKMNIPSKSLLSLLASCSVYHYVALPTTCYIMPPILPYQASNPPFVANRCLAKLPLLLSPSYSVASCRWRLEAVPCWNIYLLVGISLYCYVILMHLYTW